MNQLEYARRTLQTIAELCDGHKQTYAQIIISVTQIALLALKKTSQVPGTDQGAPQGGSGATEEDTGLSARVKTLEARLDALEGPSVNPDDPDGMPTRRELDAARWIGPARDLLERMSTLMQIVNRNAQGMGFMGNKQELVACLTQCDSLLKEDWLEEEDWDAMIDAAKEQG